MNADLGTSRQWPTFVDEVVSTLAVHSQYVLHGNVHDRYLAYDIGRPRLLPLHALLARALQQRGLECLVVVDPVHGLRGHPIGENGPAARDRVAGLLDGALDADRPPSLEQLAGILATIVNGPARSAVLVEDASRLVRNVGGLEQHEHDFFVAVRRLAREVRAQVREGGSALHNPVLWAADHERDLPGWLAGGNERFRVVAVPRPDFGDRQQTGRMLVDQWQDGTTEQASRFAEQSDGMTLQEMVEVTRLVHDRGTGPGDLSDAVRTYRLGVLDSPWRRGFLRQRIAEGEKTVSERVVGQPHAVVKTLDILKRAALGLSGAQAASSTHRPRGVLFFAGPTGVGKTELAKSVAALVFGDESAYLRFDMSEFASEHAGDRLIGAPPGYVGFESGGELTNALRQQPFRVVLFDEIEKAHAKILDKFLQILEDGRLTDGRGTTTYFSESILIFTSNLGALIEDRSGNRVANVTPGTPYAELESRVRTAVDDHFTVRLGRPELLNRFGDNIVVFDFVDAEAADRIFTAQLANILQRVDDEHGIAVTMPDDVEHTLRQWCTGDLSKGGRGIGTALESFFINPLARALFERDTSDGVAVTVTRLTRAATASAVEMELS